MTSRRSHTFEAQQRSSARKEPRHDQPIPKPAKVTIKVPAGPSHSRTMGHKPVSVPTDPWSQQ